MEVKQFYTLAGSLPGLRRADCYQLQMENTWKTARRRRYGNQKK